MATKVSVRPRRLIVFLIVSLIVTASFAVGLSHYWAAKDRVHAEFYATGKSINDFLSSYCRALEESHRQQSPQPLMELYSSSYAASGRGRLAWSEPQALGNVLTRHRRAVDADDYDLSRQAAELGEELAGFSALEKTVCKIDLIEETDRAQHARLTVKLILDSVDLEGHYQQDRLFFRWFLAKEHDGSSASWKIRRDELVEGIRVTGDRSAHLEIDPRDMGIDFVHRRDPRLDMKAFQRDLRFGVVQHGSGGIAAADYDGDGRTDLLLLGGVESKLYRHEGVEEGRPRFVDVTREEGLAGLSSAHSALFADFDNDGDRDLFVARYLAPNRYFENLGEDAEGPTFQEKSAAMGLGAVMPSSSSTVLDFDRDGYLDLYVAAFGNAFEALPRLPFFATNGGANRLYRNDRGRGFIDVTEATGTGDTGWSLATSAVDVDDDGWVDLAVANDFGRKTLYRNNGPDSRGRITFTDVAKEAGVLDFSGGMGLVFGDVDNDGREDLYTSNINSNQRWYGEDITVGQYARNVMRSRWFLRDFGEYLKLFRLLGLDWMSLGKQVGEGNSLFRNLGPRPDAGIAFEESRESQAERVGWGWGVALYDADNDSDLDLYAANGWISNTPKTDL